MATIGPFGYTGGLNTIASGTTIGKDQLSDAQNVRLVEGDLVKLSGSRTLNSSAISGTPAVTGISDWQTAAGQRYQVFTAGTKIFQTADLGTTFTDITGATTITAGNKSTFASLNNRIVRCGGTDAPIVWTGTGNASALGGSPPSGNIVCTTNNFMFISGIAATPSRIYWSAVGDPTTWPSTSFVDFRKDDGDKITALSVINNNLIIFKRMSIGILDTTSSVVSGTSTLGPLYPAIQGIGCSGPLALDNLPDGSIAFLGNDSHMYIFDGSICTDVSDKQIPESNIQTLLDGIINQQNAVVKYYPFRKEIWLSATNSGSSTNNIIFLYDYTRKVWVSRVTNINANVMGTALDTRATISHNYVLLTGNYAGQVYEQDYLNSNPEASNSIIDGYGTTSILFSGNGSDFIPRSAMVNLEFEGSYSLEFNYGYNDYTNVTMSNLVSMNSPGNAGLDSFVLDVNALGSSGPLRQVTILNSTNQNATIQVQLRNRYAGQPFVVHPFYLSDEVLI